MVGEYDRSYYLGMFLIVFNKYEDSALKHWLANCEWQVPMIANRKFAEKGETTTYQICAELPRHCKMLLLYYLQWKSENPTKPLSDSSYILQKNQIPDLVYSFSRKFIGPPEGL
jgi:hypothetical protein